MKPTDTFLPGLMSIWKLIRVLIFTNTSLKIRNANQFVMRNVFQFLKKNFLKFFARTKYNLKLKEGMHIKWLKLCLNKQIKCFFLSIFVYQKNPTKNDSVCPLILCHLDICLCYNPFYTLRIFD